MDFYYNVAGQGVIIMSFFVDLYQCMRMFTLLRRSHTSYLTVLMVECCHTHKKSKKDVILSSLNRPRLYFAMEVVLKLL